MILSAAFHPLVRLGIMMSTTGKRHISKSSQVDRARARLEEAVARLDRALSNRAEPSPDRSGDDLAALQAENASLRETTRAVSGRLEQTIGKLKSVLES